MHYHLLAAGESLGVRHCLPSQMLSTDPQGARPWKWEDLAVLQLMAPSHNGCAIRAWPVRSELSLECNNQRQGAKEQENLQRSGAVSKLCFSILGSAALPPCHLAGIHSVSA